ncbi:MAG: hypothetical protein LUD29_04200 [Clostridia bacterium]|nr:hypothetical protein [Clostridia bacterium]
MNKPPVLSEHLDNVLRYADSYTEFVDGEGLRYVGPEHIVMSMLYYDECAAAKIIGSFGVTFSDFVSLMPLFVDSDCTDDGFTKKSLDFVSSAYELAMTYSSAYVGSEHVLLTVLNGGANAAMKILSRLGLKSSSLTKATLSFMGVDDPEIACVTKDTDQVSFDDLLNK